MSRYVVGFLVTWLSCSSGAVGCASEGSSVARDGGLSGSAGSSGGSAGASTGGGAGSGGTAGTGGSGATSSEECPDSPPTQQADCPIELSPTGCSYGDSILPECREQWRCECISQQPGIACAWQPAAGTGFLSCTTRDAGVCPSVAPVAAADGGLPACDTATDGARCGYTDGTICRCTSCLELGGPCQPVNPPRWICSPAPSAPCPATIPNLGTACSQLDLRCVYDSSCGIEATCEPSGWTWRPLPCPQ